MPAGATVGAACDGSRKTAASCNAQLGLVCIPTGAGSNILGCDIGFGALSSPSPV